METKITDDVEKLIDNKFYIHTGESISVEDTYELTAKEPSKLIIFAGPSDCGKTALLTAIYQLFLDGPVDKYYFAGSRSLVAFEQRAFTTRARSGLLKSNTMKTRRGVKDILHIRLWDSEKNAYYNLLLSDFSGEEFTSVCARADIAVADFDIVNGAKDFILILDGDLLTKKDMRHSTLQNALTLFRTFADSKLIDYYCNVVVVFSKYDIIMREIKDNPSLEKYIQNVKLEFDFLAAKYNKKVQYFNTSVLDTPELKSRQLLVYVLDFLIEGFNKRIIKDYVVRSDIKSQFNMLFKRGQI